MDETKQTVTIAATVEISPKALQTIVETATAMAARDERGRLRVDTAAKVSEMISRFLRDRDFESYVGDPANHR